MRKISRVKEKQFWITNISEKNVCLADLALTIPTKRHMNLLDSKHFNYTEELLMKSKESGSLFKKQRLIKIREVAPDEPIKAGKYVSKEPLFMKNIRAGIEIVEPYFEELQVSEEKFVDDLTQGEDAGGGIIDTMSLDIKVPEGSQ
jgi:hypothetical protein